MVGPDARVETWSVTFGQERANRIQLGWCDVLTFGDEHPLLWPHLGERADLYFSKRPPDPAAAIGMLWQRHQHETDGWLPFERFLNPVMAPGALLDAGDGLLAAGPTRLLNAYGEVLNSLGVPWSLAGQYLAKYWRPASEALMAGGEWVVEDQPLKALILGESYVVAARFAATRQ
jgi:hypothetical protein